MVGAAAPLVLVRGAGSIGARHARAFSDPSVGARVVVWPVRPGRTASGPLEGLELVDDAGAAALRPDGVVVATDTGRHLADVEGALHRGAHVLCEKPLAPSAAGVGAVAAASRAAGREVFVACNLRFHAALGRFRELLPQAGALHSVRIECQSFLPDWRPGTDHRRGYAARADEGGVMRDLVHEIDYALWLYGVPHEVTAWLSNTGRLEIDAEETADLVWRHAGGPTISVRLDYLSRPTRRRMTACGTNGTIEWDGVAGTVSLFAVGRDPVAETLAQPRDAMMQAQARAFLEAMAGRASAPLATLGEGARAVDLLDAARRASASGRTEALTDGSVR